MNGHAAAGWAIWCAESGAWVSGCESRRGVLVQVSLTREVGRAVVFPSAGDARWLAARLGLLIVPEVKQLACVGGAYGVAQ